MFNVFCVECFNNNKKRYLISFYSVADLTGNKSVELLICHWCLKLQTVWNLFPLLGCSGCEGNVMPLWTRVGSQIDASFLANPTDETQKQEKRMRTICLDKMKPRRLCGEQSEAAVNSISPFMIRCQIGKEIKDICSNCRGAEPLPLNGEEES